MGRLEVDTGAVVAGAGMLGRVSSGVSAGSGLVAGSSDAAGETAAAGAYSELVAQYGHAVAVFGQAGDQLAVAARAAAACYVASDRLTG